MQQNIPLSTQLQSWRANSKPFTAQKSLKPFILLFRGTVAVILCVLLFGSSPAQAAPLTIDSFETDQALLDIVRDVDPIPSNESSSIGGSAILGGERDIEIRLNNSSVKGNGVRANVNSGLLSIGMDPITVGSAWIVWDGADNSPAVNHTGLGGVDLTVGGTQDAFLIVIPYDDNPVDIIIEVFTDAGNSSTYTLSLSGDVVPPAPPQSITIPYSSFAPNLGGGANFANVGAITWSMVDVVVAPDLVFDSFSTTSTEPPDDDDDDEEEPPEERPRYRPPAVPPSSSGGGGGGPLPTTTPVAIPTALPPSTFPTTLPETGDLSATWSWFTGWPTAVSGLGLVAGAGLFLLVFKRRKQKD